MRFHAVVAQLEERLPCKRRVAGSTPVNGLVPRVRSGTTSDTKIGITTVGAIPTRGY